MFLVSSCSCLCPIHWSQVLSWEWRYSWSSADRQCSNYIWVINNFIAYKGVSYIRDLTVSLSLKSQTTPHNFSPLVSYKVPSVKKIDLIIMRDSTDIAFKDLSLLVVTLCIQGFELNGTLHCGISHPSVRQVGQGHEVHIVLPSDVIYLDSAFVCITVRSNECHGVSNHQ